MTTDEARAEILNRLPMVRWDRCVRLPDGAVTVYGWIARDDGRSDFVLVAFLWPDDPLNYYAWTSSVEHDDAISAALFGDEDCVHTPCERVGDVFGGLIPNRVGAA